MFQKRPFPSACSDNNVTTFNAEPEAESAPHSGRDKIFEGHAESARGLRR